MQNVDLHIWHFWAVIYRQYGRAMNFDELWWCDTADRMQELLHTVGRCWTIFMFLCMLGHRVSVFPRSDSWALTILNVSHLAANQKYPLLGEMGNYI